jgi:hypothetical protein
MHGDIKLKSDWFPFRSVDAILRSAMRIVLAIAFFVHGVAHLPDEATFRREG